MIDLIFPDGSENLPFLKLGEDPPEGKSKVIWVFPDIEKTFGVVYKENGAILIDPSMYYVTSGEATKKTEILIDDIRKLMENNNDEDILNKLSDLLINVSEFMDVLKKTKSVSKFLEVTKCEDGIYSGNICSRKDPRKKKEKK